MKKYQIIDTVDGETFVEADDLKTLREEFITAFWYDAQSSCDTDEEFQKWQDETLEELIEGAEMKLKINL
jgi:hypothetical protein